MVIKNLIYCFVIYKYIIQYNYFFQMRLIPFSASLNLCHSYPKLPTIKPL